MSALLCFDWTGHDILFFWVARMVMMGLQLTGQLPFHTVRCENAPLMSALLQLHVRWGGVP